MDKPLRILNVEDSERDSALLARHIMTAGYDLFLERVETAEGLKAAIVDQEWDLILCDYSMPRFSALAALTVLRASRIELPFIIISGTVGEEIAVKALLSGANDYIPKGNLTRLIPAIQRELQQAENRLAKRIAEEALKASEGELRALFAAMNDVIIVFDYDGRHLKVAPTNPEHVYSRGTYRIGKTVHEIFPRDAADFILANIRTCLDESRTLNVEHALSINGKERCFSCTVTPMTDDSVVWVARDITERKRADSERMVISEIIQGTVSTPNLGEFLQLVHQTIGQIVYAENCFVMLHDPVTDLCHMEYWIDKYDTPPPPHLAGKGYSNYILRTGKPLLLTEEMKKIMVETGEAKLIGSSSASWLGVPLHTPSGTIGVMVLQHYEKKGVFTQRDLEFLSSVGDQAALAIERKRAEDDLRESEERFAGAFELAPIGVALVLPDGRWLRVNRALCDLIGYTEAEMLDLTFQDITHRDDLGGDLRNLNRLISRETSHYQMEKRYVHKLGHLVSVLLHVSLVRHDNGDPRYFIAQIQDITESKRAEEELRESESLLAASQRITHLGSWVMNISDSGDVMENTERWSDEHYRIFGFEPGQIEITDEVFYNSVHPDDREPLAKMLRETIENQRPYDLEHRVILRDGTERIVHAMAEVVLDSKTGKVRKLLGSVQDITERKRAEEELQRRQTELRVLFDVMPAMIWFKDTENNILRVNKRVAEAAGMSVEEIEGRPSIAIYPDEAADFYADDLKVIRSGKPKLGYEEMFPGLGGRKRWVQTDKVPYFDETGKPIGIVVMAQDVTERKEAEKALEESEERYRELVENAIDIIYTLDPDGNYTSVSKAGERVTGYSRQQTLGRNINHTVAPEYLERAVHFHAEQLAGRDVAAFELEVIAKDGHRIALEINTRSITENGVVVGVQGIARDISERKAVEAARLASERKYQALFQLAPVGIYQSRPDGSVTIANKTLAQILGYDTVNEFLGKNFADIYFNPDDRRALFDQYLEKGVATDIDFQWKRRDGSPVWIQLTAQAIKGPDGAIEYFEGFVRDITESRVARKALEDSERSLKELTKQLETERKRLTEAQTLAKLGSWHTDLTSMEVIWSPETYQIFEPDPNTLSLNHELFLQRVHPEDREAVEDAFSNSLDKDTDSQITHRILMNDGRVKFVEERWQIVRNDEGIPQRAIGSVTDVTERTLANEALRESDEKFHQLADNISDVFWIRSPDMSRIYYISPAFEQIWGRKLKNDHTDPHEWQDFIIPQDRQRVKDAYAGLMDDKSEIEVEFRILRPDGEQRWVRARGFQVKDSSGEVIRLAGIVTDITEKKLAEAALTDSEFRYHSLFENMIEGYAYCETVFDGDQLKDFIYTEVNGAFEGLTGLKDVVGKKVSELIPGLAKASPDIFETYRRVALTGQAEKFETFVEPLAIWLSITVYSSSRETFVAVFDNITERKRAQTLLIESKEQLALAAESVNLGIWDWDVVENNLEWDSRMYELHGLRVGEFGGAYGAWQKGLHPDDREQGDANIQAALSGERPFSNDFRVVWPDGEIHYIEARALVERDDNGNAVRMIGVNWDITDRKRGETLLIESQQSLALATESASIGIWDWDLVEDTMKWDARMYELYGNYEEDFSGPSQTWNLNLHPDDRERVFGEFATAIEGNEGFHSEFCVLWPDGEVRHLESSAKVLRDTNGKALHFIGVNWDITERKVAEETLREADQRAIREYGLLLTRVAKLALALGNARELDTVFAELREFALVSTGMDGFVISLYDAKQKTRTAAYVWSEGVRVDAPSLPPMEMSNSPHSRSVLTGEIIITDDFQSAMERQPVLHLGGDIPQSSLVVPMSVMGKIVGGVEVQSNQLAAFTDSHATAMQMAANLAANAIDNVRLMDKDRDQADQLRQSQKMEAVGVLAGGIAHDFNNLLTAINGYSDLTMRKMAADDPLRHNIEEVKKAGERAAELTSQLLTFSRKKVLKPVVHNLNSVIGTIEKMLRRIIRENVELRTVLEPELGNIMADPGQIEQVIMNLAVNARDAMPDGGTLSIETKNVYLDDEYISHKLTIEPGPFARMTVSDTGIGMDQSTQKRIFEPFFTTKDVGKGTGLGLPMVYGIVKQSGGDILVYSEPGHGTTFKIYLPLVDKTVEKPKWADGGSGKNLGTETVLLVEDEEVVRNLVREILSDNGYKVLEASSGKIALSICESYSEPIHLLLTDVIMPNMGGAELKKRVVDLVPEIKVLFISGYTDDSIADRGIDDRTTAFLEKPFTPDALARKVREALERK